MTFQSAPECAEAVLHFSGTNASMANVVHFRKTGGYDQHDIDQLADDVDNAVGLSYLPAIAVGVAYVQTVTRGLENLVDFQGVSNTNAGNGTFSGTLTLPFNCSLCVTLRTGATGRSARGRFYAMPTTSSALVLDNVVSSTYAALVETAVEEICNSAASDGWVAVVLSRYSNKALRTTAVARPITDITVRNTTMDSQRGRLPKGH